MNNRKAFTIVELVTVVIIIAVLLGILLPSVSAIRAKAKETAQKAQFVAIEMALEAFKQDYGDYPPSNWPDPPPPPGIRTDYCGAQKITEALLGLDLMGFNPKSAWHADGTDGAGNQLYSLATLTDRKGPYLELATANVFTLGKLFNNTTPLAHDTNVLCDVFKVRRTVDNDNTGKPIMAGAPILYYKANTASKIFDPNIPGTTSFDRIYNYMDDDKLVRLGKLTANGVSVLMHPFAYPPGGGIDNPVFYSDKYVGLSTATYGGSGTGYGIRDTRFPSTMRPYKPDTYILISAGPDGYYGTADDIHNY